MPSTKQFLAAVIAITAFIVFPSAASAANYCVGASPACTNSPVAEYPANATGITNAINAAASNSSDNVVYIAAGPYAIQPTTFPTLPSSTSRLSIIGAGVGQTVFSGTVGSGPFIDLQLRNSLDSLSGFTLNVAFTSGFVSAVSTTRGDIHDFAINQTGSLSPGTPAAALEMHTGTSAYDGTIDTSSNTLGVSLFDGATALSRVSITGSGAGSGVLVGGTANTDLSNLKIVGHQNGVRIFKGTVELTDSLVDLQGGTGSNGIVANDQDSGSSSAITVNAARNTIVGSGASTGIYLATQEAGDSIGGSFKDTVIYDTNASSKSMYCNGFAGSTVSFVLSGLATNLSGQASGTCTPVLQAPTSITLLSSPFVDFAARDLHPAWNSPIVDAGGTTFLASGDDAAGGERIVDGDNDGTAIVDLGAFEYQAAPPAGAISAPSTGVIGQALSFTHSMVDPDPTNSITGVEWDFGDGSTSTLASPTHAYAAAGTYNVTLSATNQAGSIGTATAQIVIPVIPATPAKPSPVPPVAAVPPSATVTSKPKKSFKVGKKGVVLAPKGSASFSVSFTGATSAKFAFQSIGRKKKLKALKGSQTLSVSSSASPVKFSFGGTWNKKKLAAGSYRVTITPIAADGKSGTPVTVDLKLKK